MTNQKGKPCNADAAYKEKKSDCGLKGPVFVACMEHGTISRRLARPGTVVEQGTCTVYSYE